MSLTSFLRGLFSSAETRAPPPPAHSEPLRLTCARLDEIPPAEELAARAVTGRHVVLHLAGLPREPVENLLHDLEQRLPDHSVFVSYPAPHGGIDAITVYKVIDRAAVLGDLPLWLLAVREYVALADDLCVRLATAHGLKPAELLANRHRGRCAAVGRLGAWRYHFHGFQCQFLHRDGTVVDVNVCHGDEFGTLDPYFFSRYVRSSPARRDAAALLSDDFHDACRVFTILTRLGRLKTISAPVAGHQGYSLPRLVLAERPQVTSGSPPSDSPPRAGD